MKFLLDQPDISITGTVTGWHDLGLTRRAQVFRNDLGAALHHVCEQILDRRDRGGGSGRSGFASLSFHLKRELERQQRSELVGYLRRVGDAISNNGANDGSWWRPELEKTKSGEAA